MKFKMLAPIGLLCLSFSVGLVGCSNATTGKNPSNMNGATDLGDNALGTEGVGVGMENANGTGTDTGLNIDTNGVGTGTDTGLNNNTKGNALSNQINGIFGSYGTDGNRANGNRVNGNAANLGINSYPNNGSLGYGNQDTLGYANGFGANGGLLYNNANKGYQFGYGDGMDSSIGQNYTARNRFGFGMKGAHNILGNSSNRTNKISTRTTGLNSPMLEKSLMS